MDDISRYFDELLEILKTNEELRKSAQGIFKQMAWAAGGTAVGGVVLGPAGAMAGGLVGSAIGYLASDEYTALIKAYENLNDRDKKKIVTATRKLVKSDNIVQFQRFIKDERNRKMFLKLAKEMKENI